MSDPRPHNGSGQNQINTQVSRVGEGVIMAVGMGGVPHGNLTPEVTSPSAKSW